MAIHNEDSDMDQDIEDEEMDQEEGAGDGEDGRKKVYIPGISRPLKEGEELDYDPEAYRLFHTFETDNPCLSFDVLNDKLGDNREATPLTCYLVGGTQVEKKNQNQLIVMRLSNMYNINKEDEGSDDSEKEDDSDDEEAEERKKSKEPALQAALIRHNGEINRVKSQTIGPTEVCAVWNALGKVQIWNLNNALEKLDEFDNTAQFTKLDSERPLHSFEGHSAEGYALGWSPLKQGALASGDNHRKIYTWQMSEGGKWHINQQPLLGHEGAVEDIQWSYTDEPLLISTSVDKSIRLWDIRAPAKQACVCVVENAHDSDINVVSWNKHDPLLVTGSDDAQLKIWSLKNIQYGQPVARFKYHKSPITSVEWAPHDNTTFMASGEDNQITFWDLSMETEGGASEDLEGVPPQLLFVHMGLEEIKEVHWHPKATGLAIATAANGFHVFRTCNI